MAQMHKKAYVAIASVIAEVYEKGGDEQTLTSVHNGLVRVFSEDNPNFDASRFEWACFGEGQER